MSRSAHDPAHERVRLEAWALRKLNARRCVSVRSAMRSHSMNAAEVFATLSGSTVVRIVPSTRGAVHATIEEIRHD